MKVKAEFPEKLKFLFTPSRYKIAHGGRGGAKSWGFARALIILAAQKPLRVLCTREIQNSLQESVHKLLSDQIYALGLSDRFQILQAVIRGPNGSEFIFEGLRHNTDKIKSMEGVDICWVEEAEKVSDASWSVLIPTIRKPGSEIWVSFNPSIPQAPTWQRFVANPPPGAQVVKIGWQDNPWFPKELRDEMEHLKATDYEEYLHVWEGEFRQFADGAVYKNELIKARQDGRITRVDYDPILPVQTFWDIGVGDSTAIWFAQAHHNEFRIIDYYEANGQPIDHYAKVIQGRGYMYGEHWLPHDAQARELGTGRSIQEVLEGLGLKVVITPKLSIEDGINAARMAFSKIWIDAEKCARGIECLQHYHREYNERLDQLKMVPVHDWSSHAADAFRYLAVALKEPIKRTAPRIPSRWAG